MPTGGADTLTPVAQFIEWLQPRRVLDVGVGAGRMGFLSREYGNVEWLRNGGDNGIVVDGIEGYEPYLGDVQRAVYDNLIVGEANEILSRMAESERRYDLVVAAEILEHFTAEDGSTFIDRCRAVGDIVLVATPGFFFGQEIPENPYETHRSFWSRADLKRVGATAFLHQGLSTVCLFGDARIAQRYVATQPTSRRPRWFQWFLPSAWEQLLRRYRTARRDRQDDRG